MAAAAVATTMKASSSGVSLRVKLLPLNAADVKDSNSADVRFNAPSA